MSLSFAIGFVVGLILVAVVCVIVQSKNKKCEYDERQIAMRGLAYKAGFITFILCEAVVFIIEVFKSEALVLFEPGVLSFFIILFSLLVFILVAIFKDAYFSPNKPMSKRWYIVMILLGIISLLRGFTADEIWYMVFNFGAGGFVMIVMIAIAIKMLISKKTEAEEDEE